MVCNILYMSRYLKSDVGRKWKGGNERISGGFLDDGIVFGGRRVVKRIRIGI